MKILGPPLPLEKEKEKGKEKEQSHSWLHSCLMQPGQVHILNLPGCMKGLRSQEVNPTQAEIYKPILTLNHQAKSLPNQPLCVLVESCNQFRLAITFPNPKPNPTQIAIS